MEYRFLGIGEWDKIKSFFPNTYTPDPVISKVVVAESDTGEIAGLLVLQTAIHLEPLKINEKYKGKVRFDKLFTKMEEAFQSSGSYYVFTTSELTERMAKFGKLVSLPWKIWRKDVRK